MTSLIGFYTKNEIAALRSSDVSELESNALLMLQDRDLREVVHEFDDDGMKITVTRGGLIGLRINSNPIGLPFEQLKHQAFEESWGKWQTYLDYVMAYQVALANSRDAVGNGFGNFGIHSLNMGGVVLLSDSGHVSPAVDTSTIYARAINPNDQAWKRPVCLNI